MDAPGAQPAEPMHPRRYDVDALRAGAFAVLMLTHIAMVYVEAPWHVKSSHSFAALTPALWLVTRWRMGLIFMLSGIASAFLLGERPCRQFVRERSWRLLAPFAFGVLVLLPVQPYAEAVRNGVIEPDFLRFLYDYWCLRAWPEGAFSITSRLPLRAPDRHFFGVTFNHLWYLLYLWLYSVALASIVRALRSSRGARLGQGLSRLRGQASLWLPLPALLASAVWLEPRFPLTYNFVYDLHRNVVFFTLFVFGYAIARSPRFWQRVRSLRFCSLACAILLGAIAVGLDGTAAWQRVLVMLYTWTVLLAILGWGNAVLNRPFPWLPWANACVFPWYLIHQSAIVLMAYWLVPLEFAAPLELALILAGTLLSCLSITVLAQRVGWLRPWLGMKGARRAQP
ncbi:MAG TPA: acyltransferase family protein [Polyangiales bacterium]